MDSVSRADPPPARTTSGSTAGSNGPALGLRISSVRSRITDGGIAGTGSGASGT